MIFQTLDDKSECVGIYADNKLNFSLEEFPSGLTSTWKYAPYLRGLDIEYASLYLEGAPLGGFLPEYMVDDWEDVSQKIKSFKRSLSIAQVDTYENCFFDLVPERFLVEFCEARNSITEHVLRTVPKPSRYEFYKHVSMMLADISNRPITLDKRVLGSYTNSEKLQSQVKKMLEAAPRVVYNQFGTKTGRLTTQKNTFPILTLPRALRGSVKPQNDCFVELDFNGAEIRTLLGILKKPQPEGDVHEFHRSHIFGTSVSRSEAKTAFFAWLYGSRTAVTAEQGASLRDFYEKEEVLSTYLKDGQLTTPYGKVIPDVDDHHALNYLVQSTAAELLLKQALKIDYLLQTYSQGSAIAFLIHDSIILDLKNEDLHLLTKAEDLMRSTNFGFFPINRKKGQNLGSLCVF